MEKYCRQKHPKIQNCCYSEEVKSNEWEFIKMTEQEEDIIFRMHKLVGDKWALIAGRIPGRTADEIERFWVMRNSEKWCREEKEKEKETKFLSSST
ncbi:transcription factor try [Phtheirospermum japonicum]|uniref:Transcription factor try n=1 Tax=Phtheirospermum japonicum TaxID=374723 RepID=A0A830C6J0_9LAMI|nr:transcription factor try [Phtheirospermum japonicum]